MGSIDNKAVNFLYSTLEQDKKLKAITDANIPINHAEQRIMNADHLDGREKQEMLQSIKQMHQNNYLADKKVKTFAEVKKEKEAEGVYTILKSTYKQMNSEDTEWFHTKKFHLYDDMDGAEKVVHYEYKNTDGMMSKTGNGQSVVHHRSDDKDVVLRATKYHGKARQEIAKIKADYDVRGKQFHNFMKPKAQDS